MGWTSMDKLKLCCSFLRSPFTISGVNCCAPLALSLSPLFFFCFSPWGIQGQNHNLSPSSLTTTTTNGIESWFLQCWFRVWERNWGLLWVWLMVGLLWNFFVFLGFDFVGLADDWWVWWCKWVWPVIGWFSGVSGFGWWGWWCKWVSGWKVWLWRCERVLPILVGSVVQVGLVGDWWVWWC